MAKPRNRKLLTVLLALTFVLVQFIDLAVLDNLHLSAAEVHATFEGGATGHGDSDSPCAEHCAGHVPHHIYAGGFTTYGLAEIPRPARRFTLSSWYPGLTTLPPVPPPIS